MAHEIVLTRFEGKKQLKEALLCSDFGTPDLFGPLKAEMAENVKMYRTLNNREWRLTGRKSVASSKRKAPSFLTSPPVKRSTTSYSTPLVSSVAADPPQRGSQQQFSKRVFTPVRGKQGKRKGRGRGGRGQ